MSDPYLDFNDKNDLSNIQVNVFHVKDTLRGLSPSERESALHDECYVFNPVDIKNPSVPDLKCKPNAVKSKITLYYLENLALAFSEVLK